MCHITTQLSNNAEYSTKPTTCCDQQLVIGRNLLTCCGCHLVIGQSYPPTFHSFLSYTTNSRNDQFSYIIVVDDSDQNDCAHRRGTLLHIAVSRQWSIEPSIFVFWYPDPLHSGPTSSESEISPTQFLWRVDTHTRDHVIISCALIGYFNETQRSDWPLSQNAALQLVGVPRNCGVVGGGDLNLHNLAQ